METFCITAVECQLAGAIPVTSKLAALGETVYHGVLTIKGWPKNVTYQQQWLELLAKLMSDDEKNTMLRCNMREHALQYDWENVYARWNDAIDEVTCRESTGQVVLA